MKKYLSFIFIFFAIMMVHAQDAVTSQVATVQPKIMVIPYTKEGEDIRTILEDDVNKRIILTKIKEAFDSRSFTTSLLRCSLPVGRKIINRKGHAKWQPSI